MGSRAAVAATCFGLAAAVLLSGCEAVSPRIQEQADEHAAVSFHLENRSDVPVTYSLIDQTSLKTLAPHSSFTGPAGAWMVPAGSYCAWRRLDSSPPHRVVAVDSDTWTTMTDRELIVSCGTGS